MDAIANTEAAEKLLIAQAVALGEGMAMNGKDSKVKSAVRHLARRAYPEIQHDGS